MTVFEDVAGNVINNGTDEVEGGMVTCGGDDVVCLDKEGSCGGDVTM